jgi:hypothetical protein
MSSDAAIEHYWSLRPTRFPSLERLVVFQDTVEEDPPFLSLELELVGTDTQSLHIVFRRVQDLKMHFPGGHRQVFLEITSIRDYQWEGLRYHVVDEEPQLSFYCRDFEAKLK